jgi:predicted acylesterase/phospholipase RssA
MSKPQPVLTGDVIDLESGTQVSPQSPIIGAAAQPSSSRKLKPEPIASRKKQFVWRVALFLHHHKILLLKLAMVQGVLYNMMKLLTHHHHSIMDYIFCSASIFLGSCVILSSAATMFLHHPSRSLSTFLSARLGRQAIAQEHVQSHSVDQLCDALAGLLMINASVNGLVWYISGLPLLPWSEVPGHYASHVLSWMTCIVWFAFALGIYSKSQATWRLPNTMQNLPACYTTQSFALFQGVARSVPARVAVFCSFPANFYVLALMCRDVNIDQSIGKSRNLEDKRGVYAGALMLCDAIHLASELLKPCAIDGWLYIAPTFTRLLTVFCFVLAGALAACSSSSYLLGVAIATVLLHIVGFLFVAMSLMGWLSRRFRKIALQPPIEEPRATPKGKGVSGTLGSDHILSPSFSMRKKHSEHGSTLTNQVVATAGDIVAIGADQCPDTLSTISEPRAPLSSLPDSLTESSMPLRILCLDGGGAKGLNTLLMLQAIESRAGRPINQLFDLICGTSIGSCIGSLASVGLTPEHMMELLEGIIYKGFENCGPVFPESSTWRLLTKGWKISGESISNGMEQVVRSAGYDTETALSSPRGSTSDGGPVPHFFSVTTEEQANDAWLPFVMSNYTREDQGFTVAGTQGWPFHKQLLASCAAPTYFPPVVSPGSNVNYVDGGIVANNPTMIAVQEAKAIWPGRPIGCIVSIGTGKSVAMEQTKAGLTYWAGKMVSMATDTYRVHKEIEAMLPCLNGPVFQQPFYSRLEPVISDLQLDECRQHVLDDMKNTTAAYISGKAEEFDRLCSVLHVLSAGSARQHPNEYHTFRPSESE